MREIIEILENLRNLSGNEQLDYLKSNKDNKILKEVLQYTYNPDLKYNISEAKLQKACSSLVRTSDVNTRDSSALDGSTNYYIPLFACGVAFDTTVYSEQYSNILYLGTIKVTKGSENN